jgi:YVTN family beta-propeller protein
MTWVRPGRATRIVATAVAASLLLSGLAVYLQLTADRSSGPPEATLNPTALKLPGGVDIAGLGFANQTGDGFYADDMSSNLVVFNLSSFKAQEIGYSGGGAYGMSYDSYNDEVYMVIRNWESAPPVYGYVDAVSLKSGYIVSSVALGQGFPLPVVGVDPKTGFVFVEVTRYSNTTLGPWLVMGISPVNGSIVWTTALSTGVATFVVDDLNDELYVLNGESPGSVAVLNGTTGRVIGTITTGSGPGMATLDPRYDQIYVGNQGSDSVSVISAASNQVVNTIPVGAWPYSIVADNATGNVLVATGTFHFSNGTDYYTDNQELDISGSSRTIVGSIPFGAGFSGFVGDTVTGVVLCQVGQTLALVNATTNRISENLEIPSPYDGVYFDSNTRQTFLLAAPLAVVQGFPSPTVPVLLFGLSLTVALATAGALASLVAVCVLVGRRGKPPVSSHQETVSRA